MLGLMGPKKMAAIIIGHGPKDSSDEKEVDLQKEAKLDAAKLFLKAIESKDAQALVDAFENMKECCESEGMEESKEDSKE